MLGIFFLLSLALDVSFSDLVPFLYLFSSCINQHLLICTDDDFFHGKFVLDIEKLLRVCLIIKVGVFMARKNEA